MRKPHRAASEDGYRRGAPSQHVNNPNAEVDCGWGRVIFGQTFDDADALIDCLRRKERDKRSVALYVREPHAVVARAPEAVFLDPSRVYRWNLDDYRASPAKPQSSVVRELESLNEAEEVEGLCRGAQMIPARSAFTWARRGSPVLSYFVAIDRDTEKVIGAAMGIDHRAAFDDSENGASVWELVADPQYPHSGVGEALAHRPAGHYHRGVVSQSGRSW